MNTPNGVPAGSTSAKERHRDGSVPLDERIEEAPGQIASVAAASTASDLAAAPDLVASATILWDRRRLLFRIAAVSLLLSLLIAFTLPKRYKSSAQIMPPGNSSVSTAMLAALDNRLLEVVIERRHRGDTAGRTYGSVL